MLTSKRLSFYVAGALLAFAMAACFYAPRFPLHHEKELEAVSMPVGRKANVAAEARTEKDMAKPEKKKVSLRICLKKEEVRFHEMILKAAWQHHMDAALIKAIIMAESGYDPKATSGKGAKGLMQLMPATAEALGER